MCLGVPGRVIKINEGGVGRALVGEIEMPVNMHFTPEAGLGDYVMIHAGTALEIMDASAAIQTMEILSVVDRREEKTRALIGEIEKLADGLDQVAIMEVCGTHTTAIARTGLKQRLPANVELISGPGCPVCVTPTGEIDMAIELAQSGRATIVTFGDMLRVPGSAGNLEQARASGAKVRVAYSPEQALKLAREESGEVCFLAVGFETTAPLIAEAVKIAAREPLDNFSILVNHRLIPPALEAVLSDPRSRVRGLICPGHVSMIIGVEPYEPLARDFNIPSVVAGFEALDVLEATAMILKQLKSGRSVAQNQYVRTVAHNGSRPAQKEIADVFTVVDSAWRGLGIINNSALALRPEYRHFDAARRFGLNFVDTPEPAGCRCGEILGGHVAPSDCPLMGTACVPENPVGPCMVSSEGSCRAEYLYG